MIPLFASMLSGCPHDCPSCCSLVVTVSDGRLTSVTGNPDHPFTQGEQVMTDTAHYADIVLPAETSMEHLDLYRSFGQLTVQLAQPALPPQGEAKSNWETCRFLARAMRVAEAHYAQGDEGLIREFLARGDATVRGITWEQLVRDGWARIDLPRPYLPFADGAPTPSGKVEFYSSWMAGRGF